MSTAAIPMGIQPQTARKRPVSKKRYEPVPDVEIRFVSVLIVAIIYLQIVVNQNISAPLKGVFLILATMILIAFFSHTLEKVAAKWWQRSFIGFNTLYFLDPADRSLKEIIVPRWRVFGTELPAGVLAISVPLGGFLNFPCIVSEYEEVRSLWRIRRREDIKNPPQRYVQLVDQFEDRVSLPVDQALFFLESKQKSLEFFPNWMQEFEDMRELIIDLAAELEAHSNECREEYITALKTEIAGFKTERVKLRRSQEKLSAIIHKSTQKLSTQQFIELIIRAFMMQQDQQKQKEQKEETHQENPEDISDHGESTAA